MIMLSKNISTVKSKPRAIIAFTRKGANRVIALWQIHIVSELDKLVLHILVI